MSRHATCVKSRDGDLSQLRVCLCDPLQSKRICEVRLRCSNVRCLQGLTTAYNCDGGSSDVVETPLSSARRLVRRWYHHLRFRLGSGVKQF
jgi:hypothetical protein